MDIGFVGLGAMGAGIVPRLMTAGHTVTGWNRRKEKAEALIASGMRNTVIDFAAAEAHGVTVCGTLRITVVSRFGSITTIPPGGTRTPETRRTSPFIENVSGP